MPLKSQSQRRWAYAAKEGKIPGVAPQVGEEFIAATPAGAKLPEKVKGPQSGRSLAGRRKKAGAK